MKNTKSTFTAPFLPIIPNLLFLLSLFFLHHTASAQQHATFLGVPNKNDQCNKLIRTSDGHYLMAGMVDNDAALYKFDCAGRIVDSLRKDLAAPASFETFNDVIELPGGEFLAVGSASILGSYSGAMAIRVSSNLKELAFDTFQVFRRGGDLQSLARATDGKVYVSGIRGGTGFDFGDNFCAVINPGNLNLTDSITVFSYGVDERCRLRILSDGSFVLCGNAVLGNIFGGENILNNIAYVRKITPSGALQWDVRQPGAFKSKFGRAVYSDVLENPATGNLIVAGNRFTGDTTTGNILDLHFFLITPGGTQLDHKIIEKPGSQNIRAAFRFSDPNFPFWAVGDSTGNTGDRTPAPLLATFKENNQKLVETNTIIVRDNLPASVRSIVEVPGGRFAFAGIFYDPAEADNYHDLFLATPALEVALSVSNGTALVTKPLGASYSYQWYSANNQPVAGATGASFTAVSGGAYRVVATDAQGCTGTASAVITPPAATYPYEQAYGYAPEEPGSFYKMIGQLDGTTLVVGQFKDHGVVARIRSNGEVSLWQSYQGLLNAKNSVFTDVLAVSGENVLIAGLCTDCEPGKPGQRVVLFRMGGNLQPIAGSTYTFLGPATNGFEARTTTKLLADGASLYVAYEGDSGFGSDVYLSQLNLDNFSPVWNKQYNTNFFETPVMLVKEGDLLALGLHGWGKTRLLKINADGNILKQHEYGDIPGRFALLGNSRYALARQQNKQLRVSVIGADGVETDSVFLNQNADYPEQFALTGLPNGQILVATHHFSLEELPYWHTKTRVYTLNSARLSDPGNFADLPENGALTRNIRQIGLGSQDGASFILIGDRPGDGGRAFFFHRSLNQLPPTAPAGWHNADVCADPNLLGKNSSKTYPHTLPRISNNVQYAVKTNYVGQPERLWVDIYRPYDHYAKGSTDKRPALIYVHGGGYLFGSEDGAGSFMLRAAQRGMIGVAVKYRLGVHPNVTHLDSLIKYAPFFQKTVYRALQDLREAVKFIYDNAEALHVDRNKIFLAGHSAGGNAVLNYLYLSQGDFPAALATELGPLPAKIPVAGVVPYAAPLNNVSLTNPVDPLIYMDAAEKEPLFLIHGTCDSTALFNMGSILDPVSKFSVGAYRVACRQQELGHPYHFAAIKGGGHGMGAAEPAVMESLFNWIKAGVLCGTPGQVCEPFSVPNNQPCAQIPLCPTCKVPVRDVLPAATIGLFPNPARNTVTLEGDSGRLEQIALYNTLGQLVSTRQDVVLPGVYALEGLASGLYWMWLKPEKGPAQLLRLVKE